MPVVRPFQGLRFTEAAGPLASNVAPPYDVISDSERAALAGQSEYNVVHLTLPEQEPDDRSKFVKYARSASRLQHWRTSGHLAPESRPAFYRYAQTFSIPGYSERLERTSLISLIKTEPYEKGVVLPHEQTFPKHKEDRLRILEATRAHLECIYGLYEDSGECQDAVNSAPHDLVADVTTPDGVRHVLQAITHPDSVVGIEQMLADKKVWIADGHHRYETACTFRAQLGERDGLVAEDFMMMALGSMADPGLVLLPTHRMLKRMTGTVDELKAKLATVFDLSPLPNGELMAAIEAVEREGGRAFGVALPGGEGLVARVRNLTQLGTLVEGDASKRLKELDVTLLHEIIFGQLLGLTGHDFFDYTRDPAEAVAAVDQGSPAAFLMNPPTVADMKDIALGGEKMPQKSTFYYPKILSGLVLWSLNDF